MRLQIAIDIADTKRVLEIADQIHDVIDIYEIGTPVIMAEGMTPVRALKQKYPKLTVLADTKIADAGALECEEVCLAGADIITVLAFSDDETIKEVADTAHKYDRKVFADLLCIADIPKRAKELLDLGVDYIGVHTGVDMQKRGRTPLKDLSELVSAIPSSQAAVAGGISIQGLEKYLILKPGIIIAGSSLYKAPDIRKACLEMKQKIEEA